MNGKVEINVDGKTFPCPVVVGSEGEVGIDISDFRSQSGCITLDPGYGNTGACKSAITFIDGEEGILRAELNLDEIAEGKFDLDVAGHYARPDIFRLTVNEEP